MGETKRVLGPLDKRKRRTRCQACSARRIKCEGGPPCKYCSRHRKPCLPATPAHDEYKFITVTEAVYTHTPTKYTFSTQNSVYMDLFAAFIQRCQFTSGFVSVDKDLFPLVHSSHLLYDLVLAIGALEASRRASCRQSHTPNKAQAMAFLRYGNALNTLRTQLAKVGAAYREDVLWSTFLFGLFELASETSGERWAKHMFHGTSKILALAGPTGLSTSLHLKLFDAFRVLEANRAILFGEYTFLSQPAWILHHSNRHSLLSQEYIIWNPTDTIFTLKLEVATFSKRLFDQIESIPQPLRLSHPTIQALAYEGIEILQELYQWHQDYVESLFSESTYTQLALVDFHALALFHCQSYSYYDCWDGLTIPSLPRDCVNFHVKAIIDLAQNIEAAPHVPGVLLLFALRIAGVHATDTTTMRIVVQRLDSIYWEGFVVSERIKLDLQEFWEYQRSLDCLQTSDC